MYLLKSIVLISAFAVLSAAQAAPAPVTVVLKDAKGESVGTAVISQLVNGVKVVAELKGLTPGEHAIHFHDKGLCQAPKFESAGGHYAGGKAKHGFDAEGGPHVGDMANFFAQADGSARVEIINTRVTLNKGEGSLLKAGGTSLVVHEKADDYKSQPAGDAGGRFACGEIKGG